MILVTVGTDLPFGRLIKHMDKWARDHPDVRVFAQVGPLGPSDYVPKAFEWTQMLSADQFDRYNSEARLIVAHAGMGSIISALTSGKPIVILPRRAHLKEHRNDHQFATAERFANRKGIFVAWTEGDLSEAIAQALKCSESTSLEVLVQFAPTEFTDRLREYILGNAKSLKR